MNILGISAFYHDSAACLVQDGVIIAAAQEERFTRRKHDATFPRRAIAYCLEAGGVTVEELDHVAFYDKPLLKFDRILETYCAFAPRGLRSFLRAMPLWLNQKLRVPREIDRGLQGRFGGRYIFLEHHESHAASAFYPSPFEEAAILSIDGVGEWATASYGVGRGNRIEITHELHFPHSLGLLYSAFTHYCGFRPNSGEYKLMGLAPYGEPVYRDLILQKLIDLKDDGSLRMDISYFNYCRGLTMTTRKFHRVFGGPPRRPESPLTPRDMDVAASIQAVTEEVMLRQARHVHEVTGMSNLCLAGGVALNCVGNGRIAREGPFERLWIQPAAGDAGGSLGAALFVWHGLLERPRQPQAGDAMRGALLGPDFGDASIRACLDRLGATYHHVCEHEVIERVTEAVAGQQVVGHMAGRLEFGPRALGARSIIGDARSPKMQSIMNRKIKFRESFRPFAPCILEGNASEYFDMAPGVDSPYMLLVAAVRDAKREILGGRRARGLDLLKAVRSSVPAVTHVDYTARVQTVDAERHPRLHRILTRFNEKTGCPVLINTSFNVRGEPIVCTPEDAYRCFMATNMDVLVIGNHLLYRDEQQEARHHGVAHLEQFSPD